MSETAVVMSKKRGSDSPREGFTLSRKGTARVDSRGLLGSPED